MTEWWCLSIANFWINTTYSHLKKKTLTVVTCLFLVKFDSLFIAIKKNTIVQSITMKEKKIKQTIWKDLYIVAFFLQKIVGFFSSYELYFDPRWQSDVKESYDGRDF